MSDADCTSGREPRSVAASFIFSDVDVEFELTTNQQLHFVHKQLSFLSCIKQCAVKLAVF